MPDAEKDAPLALVRSMVRLTESIGYLLPWANLVDACSPELATPDQLRWAVEDLTALGEIEVTPKGLRFALKEPRVTSPGGGREQVARNA